MSEKPAASVPPGHIIDPTSGTPHKLVPVAVRSPEMFSQEVTLEDGSVVKLQVVVTRVLRVDGMLDGEGNPTYLVNTVTIPSVTSKGAS